MLGRLALALKVFFLVLLGRRLSPELAARAPGLLPAPPPPPTSTSPAPTAAVAPPPSAAAVVPPPDPRPTFVAGAVHLLGLLQREGRLVDFLREEIDGYADEQIGAAVRDIHRGCRRAVTEHFQLEPVLAAREEERVTVGAGFDPSAIRLVGQVAGAPPFTGVLRHAGWRSRSSSLVPPPESFDPTVVAPAEVEL